MTRNSTFVFVDTDKPLIDELPDHMKDLVTDFCSGLTYLELTVKYNLSIGTVKSRLSRARDRISRLRIKAAA